MKRKTAFIMAFLLMASTYSCGVDPADENADSSISENSTESTEAEKETVAKERSVSLDLSDAEVKQVTRVSIRGEFSKDASIANTYKINVIDTDVVGLFGCPVKIDASEFDHAILTFKYNEGDLKKVPPENLIILHYDEENYCYDELEVTLNTASRVVSAEITEGGRYMLVDSYRWFAAWGIDIGEMAHDTVYTNDEFNFTITVPQEADILPAMEQPIAPDEAGRVKTLLETTSKSEVSVHIEYLERPDESSAQGFIKSIADALSGSAEVSTSMTATKGGAVGASYFADWTRSGFEQYTLACAFPIASDKYIYISIGFSDRDFEARARECLTTFRWTDSTSSIEIPEIPEKDNNDDGKAQSVSAADIILPALPDGITAEPFYEEWSDPNGSGNRFADIYKFDSSGYSDMVYGIFMEIAENCDIPVRSEVGFYRNSLDNVSGLEMVKWDDLVLSNGLDGESIMVEMQQASGEYPDKNGIIYIHGWYEVPENERVNFTVLADRDLPLEKIDELYELTKKIDVRKK